MDRRARYYDPEGKLLFESDNCSNLRLASERGDIELVTLARDPYPGRRLKKGELSSVKSIGYWNIKQAQEWGLPWHTNEGIEICFLESGNLIFELENERFQLHPNHLTITRPWLSHKIGDPSVEPSKLHWMIIDVKVRHPHQEWVWPEWVMLNKKDLGKLTLYLRQNEQPVWGGSNEIKECFVRIGRIIKQSGEHESRLRVLINNLLIALLDYFENGSVVLDDQLIVSQRTVKLFLESLESSYMEPWNLAAMASFCKLGTTRFSKYCGEVTNCTPMEYLQQIRLAKSIQMLINSPQLSITDIAFGCGFSSSQYFTTLFKRQNKITPQQFRKDKMLQTG